MSFKDIILLFFKICKIYVKYIFLGAVVSIHCKPLECMFNSNAKKTIVKIFFNSFLSFSKLSCSINCIFQAKVFLSILSPQGGENWLYQMHAL